MENNTPLSHDGSDSGVEIGDNQNGLDISRPNQISFADDQPQSCGSSVISGCSNYEDAYNLLVRRNSTLLEDYKLHHADGTSENGSESSSIGSRPGNPKLLPNGRKNPSCSNARSKIVNNLTRTSSIRSKPPERILQSKTSPKIACGKTPTTPNSLDVNKKCDNRRPSSSTRTPVGTPSDDGRWPSINSKPVPLMSRYVKIFHNSRKDTEKKSIEKYATLPRTRKDKPVVPTRSRSREDARNKNTTTTTRKEPMKNWMSLTYAKRKQKVKIFHEIETQTVLTKTDVEKALNNVGFTQDMISRNPVQDRSCQIEIEWDEKKKLEEQLKSYKEKYDRVLNDSKVQAERILELERKLCEEQLEKDGLKRELKLNTERVLSVLGENNLNEEEKSSGNSLVVLAGRYEVISQVVIQQEDEISTLNNHCRQLQNDLDKSIASQKLITQQYHNLEIDSVELQEFIQAEKSALSEALREAEIELTQLSTVVDSQNVEIKHGQEQCKYYRKLADKRWKQNLGLQTKLATIEANSKEILVRQGSSVSGATVAIAGLINRMEDLIGDLITSCGISEQDLEDVIFHNEAYANSSTSSSPDVHKPLPIQELSKKCSPTSESTFLSAVRNAIKNATIHSPFSMSKSEIDNYMNSSYTSGNSSSNEMLDSETEPCLMMEHVLENIILPDGHSRNLVSSCSSLLAQNSPVGMSTSLTDYKQDNSYHSLIDQVIDVDNLITKLLKVIRIIHVGHEEALSEVVQQRNKYAEQIKRQQETHKAVALQLTDWEKLGSHLKVEMQELKRQLINKCKEIADCKRELEKERDKAEKYSRDVCDLSTVVAKLQLEQQLKSDEVERTLKQWRNDGTVPIEEILGRVLYMYEKFSDQNCHLNDVLNWTDKLCDAISETKRHHDAIEHALEIFRKNHNIVEANVELKELEKYLESVNLQYGLELTKVSRENQNKIEKKMSGQHVPRILPTVNTSV